MNRSTLLAIGLALVATTIVLVVYAGRQVAYLFSFDQAAVSGSIDSLENRNRSSSRFETITISWEPVEDARSYNLYWSNRSGVTRLTGKKIAGIQPPFRFKQVEKGQSYFFVVTAVSDDGESSESEEIMYRADP